MAKLFKTLFLVVVLALAPGGVGAETEEEAEPLPNGWPRVFERGGTSVVVYQPQLDEWEDYRVIIARAAVSVKLKGDDREYFGALHMRAVTETDFETRTVLLKDSRLTDMVFPNADKGTAARCRAAVRDVLPGGKTFLISLDRIMAGLDRAEKQTRSVEVNLEPPPIFYSETPAKLVIFNREPKFEAIGKAPGLLFAINTNWDILLEVGSSKYFMLDGESWLVTEDVIKGPWRRAGRLPKSFGQLPDNEDWKAVKKRIPGVKAEEVPTIFVSTKPAELIVTQGKPTYSPISGTKLLYATNTESDLFLHSVDKHVYFLTAGRWFKAKSPEGPWSAASTNLPNDFAEIPATHKKARVLSSVPGTPEAEVAMLLASVPRKATVDRKETTIVVPYDGEPEFVEVEGTSIAVYYAVNTPYSVFRVGASYYCVHNGVWFVSSKAVGPWAVATMVPAAIYSIPPTHPKYNVTYVYVYGSTPDTVIVGYTPGYSGAYIATTGVVVFGVGYWWPYYPYPYHYHAHYYSYGCAYRYDYYYGGYYRSARYYGPYGGAGGWAGYDPRTGTYYRGGYASGPYGSVFARQAYNPYTDRYAARAGVRTPYGSWGRTVVAEGDKWARGGHRSFEEKSVGGFRTSEGAAAIGRYDKETGQGVVVGKDKYGDVYVGRDGTVYKRGDDGWQKNTGETWESIDRPSEGREQRERELRDREIRDIEQRGRELRERELRDREIRDIEQRGRELRERERRSSVFGAETRTFDNLNRERKARRLGDDRSRTFRQGSGFGGRDRGGGFGGRDRGGRGRR